MPELIYHSEKLNLNYKIKFDNNKKKVIVFQDDVNYTENEMKVIKNLNVQGLKNIHLIKNLFQGVIII